MNSILKAENVVKQYASHRALDDVSIDVPEGCIYGLLGPNGAGKTSFIRIINQITGPDSGTIYFNGQKLNPAHVNQIGYLPEERGLYKKMKVGEQVMYLAQLKGMSKKEAKSKLSMWFKKFDITPWWNKKVEELSKGMAQKIQFIVTVLHEPKLLILDEPFSGFDPINTNLVKNEIYRLKEKGTSIILSTHNMGSVEEICDNIALINHSKKILDGSVSKIREDFKDGTYRINFKGNMIAFTNALGSLCDLLDSKEVAGNRIATIRLADGVIANNLLRALVNEVEINGLEEVSPSMNDIFIKQVEESTKKVEVTNE